MEERLLEHISKLGIQELGHITQLHRLKGDFINLKCRLPNGKEAKILDDEKMYYGAEICKTDSDRCYGVAADENQLVIYEYGNGGSDAVLVLWKRL